MFFISFTYFFLLTKKKVGYTGLNSNTYSINNKLLSDNSLKNIINLFFSELDSDRKYFVLLRLQFQEDGRMVTLHKGIVLNKNSKDKYFLYCTNHLSLKSNDYLDSIFEMVTFNYFMIDKDREKFYIDKWSELKVEPVPRLEKFGNSTITFFLALNRDYQSWGNTLFNFENENLIIMSDKNLFRISNSKDGSSSISIYKGKMKLFTLIDKDFKENIFIRSLDDIDYYIDTVKNEIVLKTKKLNTKYLPKIKKEARKKAKFITIDIETIKNSLGILTPYCYSMYDGKIKKSFFSESPEELFNALLRRKYRGYTVYAHNLSKFDLIFLFKYLAK